MSEEILLKKISDAHEKNTLLEARIRKLLVAIILAFALFTVISYGNVMVMETKLTKSVEDIKDLKNNSITYENFMLFNRTYELQLEETQATFKGDMPELERIQNKYRELRSMIVQQRMTREGKQLSLKE